ncbi:MAG: selenium metabolism-associated LysR family transcriptional regulator [Oscillospiraceae bacterium]|nr:selenium metabolism-associated LysR family transcriptional regulator [Oscillospiraceae bacterium]
MDLKQLEIFLSVVEHHSFSKAAEQLYLTQPTVSAHIRTLEKELGTNLIIRSPKGAFPSEDGALLGEYARDMLALRDNALNWFQNKRESKGGEIHIAASTVPSQYVLPPIMAAFCRENPSSAFHVLRCDSGEVVEQVASRRVELGMTGTRMGSEPCDFEAFYEDQLVVITPNTERYRQMKQNGFPLEQLSREPFLVRERGSGTRREAERFLQEIGVDPKGLHVVAQQDDPESIKHAVSQGLGIAIVSELGVLDYERFQMVQVLRFDHPLLKRQLYLVTHKEHALSEPVQKLRAFVREYYKDVGSGRSVPNRAAAKEKTDEHYDDTRPES